MIALALALTLAQWQPAPTQLSCLSEYCRPIAGRTIVNADTPSMWPGVPSDPPNTTPQSAVRLLLRPEPMAIARGFLATRGKLEIGRWQVIIKNATPASVTVTSADIALAAPSVTLLDRSALLSIMSKRAGGWKRTAVHVAVLAALAVPVAGNVVKIGATATKAIAGGLTLVEIMRSDLSTQIPDIAALELTVPDSITLQPGESRQFVAWAAHVRGAKPVQAVVR